jgi:hypothetical protein
MVLKTKSSSFKFYINPIEKYKYMIYGINKCEFYEIFYNVNKNDTLVRVRVRVRVRVDVRSNTVDA